MRPLQVAAATAALLLAATAAAEHLAEVPRLRAPATLPAWYSPAYGVSLFGPLPSFRFNYLANDGDEPPAACQPHDNAADSAIDWCALVPYRPRYAPQTAPPPPWWGR